MVTTMLYGKDTLQMGGLSRLYCLTRRQGEKLKTTQDLYLLLMVRIEEEGMRSKDLAVAVGLNLRIAKSEYSATSARSENT